MNLAKLSQFVKNRDQQSWTKVKMKARTFIAQHQSDIILVVGVILISLLSFAMGYIVAKTYEKEPIQIEESSYYRGWDSWFVSWLEIV